MYTAEKRSAIVTCHSGVNERHSQPMDTGCWAVHKVRQVWRRLATPVKLGKTTLSRYKCAEAIEWIDLITGEILHVQQAKSLGLGTGVHAGEMALQRAAVLAGLREEPRTFARYLLRFRNKRRGIAPSLTQVRRWYAITTGQRMDNTARLVEPLKRADIVAGESVLGMLWQIAGKQATSREHMNEDTRAEFQYISSREKHDYGLIAKGKFRALDLLKDQPEALAVFAPSWWATARAEEQATRQAEAEVAEHFAITN